MNKSTFSKSISTRIIAVVLSALFGMSILAAPSYAGANKDDGKKSEQHIVSKVNINKADIKELTQLKGIGEKKAIAIVQFRDKYGKFKTVEQLQEVKGISKKTIENNKELIVL